MRMDLGSSNWEEMMDEHREQDSGTVQPSGTTTQAPVSDPSYSRTLDDPGVLGFLADLRENEPMCSA